MILVAAVGITTAWLVLLVPWRAPSRTLRPGPVEAITVPMWFVAGGPWWGAAIVVVAVSLDPVLALPVLAWPTARRWWHGRRALDEGGRRTRQAVPEVADLLALGLGAGLTVRAAVRETARWIDEPFRTVFGEALRRADAGEAFARALDAASADLDPAGRPLVTVLVAAERDGAALVQGLLRVGDEARHRRRTEAEARARRLPITMLLPLVLCVLPAFALLAVVPLVSGALGSLDLGL